MKTKELEQRTSVLTDENQKTLLIAGPCSIETRENLFATAEQLQNSGIDYFRAGAWKPRTRPDQFEGVGSVGLKWLKEIKTVYGLKTCTEVANFKHVYEALRNEIDMIWIGARTTSNPFAVQEIAESLSGVDIPVWIKNPVNPDLNLWIGAVERFKKTGHKQIGAIHRGFSMYHHDEFRNPPKWQIPIDLKKEIPDLPIIVDPSHITGDKLRVAEVSQLALDLNFDGLMIEVHHNPTEAWSDSKQQITPTEFMELIKNLRLPVANNFDHRIQKELENYRTEIDMIDSELLSLFHSRMQVVDQIGSFKRKHNLTILQKDRWYELLQRSIDAGNRKGLSKRFIERVFKAIHQESIIHQSKIIGN